MMCKLLKNQDLSKIKKQVDYQVAQNQKQL